MNRAGFQPPAGRRTKGKLDIMCGACGNEVPDGACIVVNFRCAGEHQMFCPGCIPSNVRPYKERSS